MRFRNPPSALSHTLIVVALIWFLIGLGIALGASPPPPGTFHGLMPIWLRVGLWWVPAVMALWTLATGRHATLTVGLLWFAPAIRVVSFTLSWFIWLMHQTPLDAWLDDRGLGIESPGTPFGWYAAVLHLGVVGVVITLALLVREDRATRGELR